MARQSKKVALKDGYYMEIKSSPNSHQTGILLRRNTKKELELAMKQYEKTKDVRYYGHIKDQKLVTSN